MSDLHTYPSFPGHTLFKHTSLGCRRKVRRTSAGTRRVIHPANGTCSLPRPTKFAGSLNDILVVARVPLQASLDSERAHTGPTLVRLLTRVLSHVEQEAGLAAIRARADSAREALLVGGRVLDEVDVATRLLTPVLA